MRTPVSLTWLYYNFMQSCRQMGLKIATRRGARRVRQMGAGTGRKAVPAEGVFKHHTVTCLVKLPAGCEGGPPGCSWESPCSGQEGSPCLGLIKCHHTDDKVLHVAVFSAILAVLVNTMLVNAMLPSKLEYLLPVRESGFILKREVR